MKYKYSQHYFYHLNSQNGQTKYKSKAIICVIDGEQKIRYNTMHY